MGPAKAGTNLGRKGEEHVGGKILLPGRSVMVLFPSRPGGDQGEKRKRRSLKRKPNPSRGGMDEFPLKNGKGRKLGGRA